MPSHRPIGESLNAAASVALKWVKRTSSKRALRMTTVQQSQECAVAISDTAKNVELPEIDFSSFIDEHALYASPPAPSEPPFDDLTASPEFHSGRSSSDDNYSTRASLVASSSTTNSTTTSPESSPSSRVQKSPLKALSQDDYFYLYLAPNFRSTQFTTCQSDSLPSVFEDDSEDEQPFVKKVAKKVIHKPSKSEPNVILPLNLRTRSPKLISSRSSYLRNSTRESSQSTE